MTPFVLVLVRIALGSGMFVLGVNDFRRAPNPDPTSYLNALDDQLLGRYSDEVRVVIRKATATLLIAAGLFVSASIFFTTG